MNPEETSAESSTKVSVEDESVLYTKVVAGGPKLKVGDQFSIEA